MREFLKEWVAPVGIILTFIAIIFSAVILGANIGGLKERIAYVEKQTEKIDGIRDAIFARIDNVKNSIDGTEGLLIRAKISDSKIEEMKNLLMIHSDQIKKISRDIESTQTDLRDIKSQLSAYMKFAPNVPDFKYLDKYLDEKITNMQNNILKAIKDLEEKKRGEEK